MNSSEGVESLSINDQAELARFRKALVIIDDAKKQGSSRAAAIRQACIEVYGNEFGDDQEKHVTGEDGVRDTENPCVDFKFGNPHENNRCEGDGHYLCQECEHLKLTSSPEQEEETK